jgi:DNA-binding transcriptional ArsR family regulator
MNNHVFKALADPTRREILRLLAKSELSAGALAEKFDMTKPTVSHHFAVLKEADLITSRREGQQIIYSLNTTVAQDVLTWLWDLFGTSAATAESPTQTSDLAAASLTKTRKKT